LPALPTGLWNYDANDRITTDIYDANGNTISAGGTADAYDFENHLVGHGFMTFVYDGDGNRVAKTVGGVTTSFLVDTNNPTGYAQVLDELRSGAVTRSYAYGLELISETQFTDAAPPASPWATSFYGYDGHGSVRYLTNATGAVTDTYDYDAFGNLLSPTGSTPNLYLFAGEQFDPDLGLYYNRARYLDVRTGRFWGMDSYAGDIFDPISLHKYLYVEDEPVDNSDPCGLCMPSTGPLGNQVQQLIFQDFEQQTGSGIGNIPVNSILNLSLSSFKGGLLRPDLVDTVTFTSIGQVYEIKSVYSEAAGLAQVLLYAAVLSKFDKERTWIPGFTYLPTPIIPVNPSTVAFVSLSAPGVVTYCLVNQLELTAAALGVVAGALSQLQVDFGVATLETAMAF
jgi:RHS repeat-associated protein